MQGRADFIRGRVQQALEKGFAGGVLPGKKLVAPEGWAASPWKRRPAAKASIPAARYSALLSTGKWPLKDCL